jgi:hypothetical protein
MSEIDSVLQNLGNVIKREVNQALARAETLAEIPADASASIKFTPTGTKGIYGKGLQWQHESGTKQFVYRANQDRIFSTETIDLQSGKSYSIDNTPVLTLGSLGPSVKASSLTSVGTLNNLRTNGDLTVDETIFYNAASGRIGINTDSPNGMLSLVTLDAEFIIEPEGPRTKIGNYTADHLDIITDNTARISISSNGDVVVGKKGGSETKITVYGKLGIGVMNVESDVDISTQGPIRMQGKKMEVGFDYPNRGSYEKGDIIWNEDPKPTGYVGWICVRTGTPGVWKPFGQISK